MARTMSYRSYDTTDYTGGGNSWDNENDSDGNEDYNDYGEQENTDNTDTGSDYNTTPDNNSGEYENPSDDDTGNNNNIEPDDNSGEYEDPGDDDTGNNNNTTPDDNSGEYEDPGDDDTGNNNNTTPENNDGQQGDAGNGDTGSGSNTTPSGEHKDPNNKDTESDTNTTPSGEHKDPSNNDIAGTTTTTTVTPEPVVLVESITVTSHSITMMVNETYCLTAIIYPANANNKTIYWSSSNESVAKVNSDTGLITAISRGITIITAKTEDGEKTDVCRVTVDPREKVIIKKDNHSFYVEFCDGIIWKNIGCDMSLDENKSGYSMSYPDSYSSLYEHERRYVDNVKNIYLEEQIAYLYLLDPLGIEYYMRTNACDGLDIMSGEFLRFKDEVYEKIFGSYERNSGRFYFKIIDGDIRYGGYANEDRMDVYSNAEILFGSHTIINWSNFWQSIGEFIFENIPVISHVLLGVEMYQALFFSGSVVGSLSSVASEYLDDYAKETQNTVLEKMLGWPKTIFNCFAALAEALVGAFELNNLNDMTIYSKIQEQDYRTVFENYGSELSIEEIISKCSNN